VVQYYHLLMYEQCDFQDQINKLNGQILKRQKKNKFDLSTYAYRNYAKIETIEYLLFGSKYNYVLIQVSFFFLLLVNNYCLSKYQSTQIDCCVYIIIKIKHIRFIDQLK